MMKRLTMGVIFLVITLGISSGAWAKWNVHNLVSDDGPDCLIADGKVMQIAHPGYGGCVVSWKQETRYGFFNAKINTMNGYFEFQLVSISNCDDEKIEGFFDIYIDGILKAEGVVGKLTGLDGVVGDKIEFCAGTSQCNPTTCNTWYFSAEIDYRHDH
jgi:hypothetical protein